MRLNSSFTRPNAVWLLTSLASAVSSPANEPDLTKFESAEAPAPHELVLITGDHLAVCAGSIMEPKMSSPRVEVRLTKWVPSLQISMRPSGFCGERERDLVGAGPANFVRCADDEISG